MKKSEYIDLIKQIKYHDDLYYNQSQPKITDSEYDKLYFKLQSYEKEHPDLIDPDSPTQVVSHETTTQKVTHPFPLLSLKKANTYEEVSTYLNKFTPVDPTADPETFMTDTFWVQTKEDGLTIALYYNWIDNQPFVAATRGGGAAGQDVTKQMQAFAKFGEQFTGPVIVRGEAILTHTAFEALNADGTYMNPRNAVAGLLHTEAPANAITFVAYNIENAEALGLTTEREMLSQLADWGFDIPVLRQAFDNITTGRADLVSFITDFETNDRRTTIDHDIDGLVIKPDYIGNRLAIGHTQHHPKNQLAYKFASPDAITTLRDVVWQSGAKGRLTPVAIFDPVELLGATITKASLANYGNIEARDIRLYDKILVRRSNDVIPQIVKSFPEERTGVEEVIPLPPSAHFVGAHLFNEELTAEQVLNKWKNFISKNGLDIKYTSGKAIQDLIDADLIDAHDLSSLWDLPDKVDDLIALKGWSTLKADKLVRQLATPLQTTMPKVLVALGLNNVGPDTATKIALLYPTIDAVVNDNPTLSLDEWHEQVGNISEEPVQALLDQKELLQKLAPHLTFAASTTPSASSKLADNNFAITGKAEGITRESVVKLIEENGGTFQKTLSAKTDYLIELSPNPRSSKHQKALKNNTSIINLKKLQHFIRKGLNNPLS